MGGQFIHEIERGVPAGSRSGGGENARARQADRAGRSREAVGKHAANSCLLQKKKPPVQGAKTERALFGFPHNGLGYPAGAQATGAHADGSHFAAGELMPDTLQIGIEHPFGFDIGMAHIVADLGFLPADFTFSGHGNLPVFRTASEKISVVRRRSDHGVVVPPARAFAPAGARFTIRLEASPALHAPGGRADFST